MAAFASATAQPKPPVLGALPGSGKFDDAAKPQPVPAQPAPSGKFADPAPAPAAPPPVLPRPAIAQPSTPAPAAIPADEPAAVARLRSMLGPGTTLRYARAEPQGADGARLTDAVLERPDQRIAIAALQLRGLRGDGVAEAEASALRLTRTAGDGATLTRLLLTNFTVRQPPAGAQLTPDMLSADRLRLEGLATEGANAVRIAELEVEDYGVGRASRFRMAGLDVRATGAGPVDHVRLANATVRGIDLAAGFAALVAGGVPAQPPGSFTMEANGLAVAGADRALGSFGRLSIDSETGADRVEVSRMALTGLRVEPFPAIEDWLRRFGYAALGGEITGESRLSRATGRLDLTNLSLALNEAGTLRLAFALEGVDSNAQGPERFVGARLLGFTLGWRDTGLYPRFVRDQARQTGTNEAATRQQFAQQSTAQTAAPGPEGEGLRQIGEAMRRFALGQAREVEIVARPPAPVPMLELSGIGGQGLAGVQRLGLTASAR